jgi:hypothetical protein
MNNLKVYSVSDVAFSGYFGFTEAEVQQMLKTYGLEQYHDTVKQWYDGYHFGKTEMYCPWDITNYCFDMQQNPDAQPKAYWLNTS